MVDQRGYPEDSMEPGQPPHYVDGFRVGCSKSERRYLVRLYIETMDLARGQERAESSDSIDDSLQRRVRMNQHRDTALEK